MSRLIEETIPDGLAGERVDRVVAMIADVSRSSAARLIDGEAVRIGGRVVTSGSERVVAGVVLAIDLADPVGLVVSPDPTVEFQVIYEDDHILVIDKPAGLVVHPGAGHVDRTLVNGIIARYPEVSAVGETHRPGIVHRLDRGTSGLLVAARSTTAYTELVHQMSGHEPERVYAALVWGSFEAPSGVIDAPIGRSIRQPTRMAVVQSGRPAITHYSVESAFSAPNPTTLLTCRLETGRTHQIRVHLSAIGHPVVGDRDYGGGRPGIDPGRPFLHARMLVFVHPVSGDAMRFESDLPDDLVGTLADLR